MPGRHRDGDLPRHGVDDVVPHHCSVPGQDRVVPGGQSRDAQPGAERIRMIRKRIHTSPTRSHHTGLHPPRKRGAVHPELHRISKAEDTVVLEGAFTEIRRQMHDYLTHATPPRVPPEPKQQIVSLSVTIC